MIPIKSLIHSFLFCVVLLTVGCVSKTEPDPPAGSPQVVNRLIANNITPPDFQSRNQSLITLSYTSIDNDFATSCTLSHLNNITVSQACSCDGMGVCNVGVTGVGAYYGAGSFSFNVAAAGKTSTTGKANFNITAAAPGSNVPPVILPSPIDPQSTSEGVATSPILFTISDSDSVVSCSDVTATSSNTTLVPVASIVISGNAPNCRAIITPAANTLGSSNIEFTLTDRGTPLPAATAVTSFTLTVTGYNDPPTIGAIGTQGTLEDTLSSDINFTIGDIDSVVNCSNVTATSSNTGLISNASIVIFGTAPNCKVRMMPNLNQSGSSNITLILTDNGFPTPAKTATRIFSMVVAPVNDAPVVGAIATQNTTENVAKNVSFTITDVDSNLTCNGSVVVTSSNTTLVPNTNISVTGIAPNCVAAITPANAQSGVTSLTVTVSDNGFPMPVQTSSTSFNFMVAQVNHAPTISNITNKSTNEDTASSAIAFNIADSDSIIYCSNVTPTSSNTGLIPNGNIVISGTTPNCTAVITPVANGYGSSTITLTLNDNGTPMPALTATSVFTLTVNAVNDVPTISTITNKTTAEGTASSAIAFTINDSDSTLSCTSGVTAVSSNTTLIPNANITFSGTAPDCIAIVTPAATGNGTATLTFTVTDNGTPLPALTANTAFTMTVTQVNHAPTISAIAAQSTNEDVATGLIPFMIADSDSTVYCSNVAGTSSNATLVPNANIVITGTAPNCTVKITPTANAYGTVAITLTITDNGTPLPAQTGTSIFNLTINAVNDAPTISAITNKSTDEDVASNAIAFTISDIDSSLICSNNVVATSSNTTVIPDANIVISGTAPNCNAVITGAANQSGAATITLTLSDNGTPMPALIATTNFVMTIRAVPDLTGALTLANLSGVASSYLGNSYGRTLSFTGLTSDESLSSLEMCLGTASGSCDVTSWVEVPNFSPTGSAPTISLGNKYRIVSNENGAQNFSLTASCSSTTNYYYSVRGTNASSQLSNTISTPAWSFWEPSCLGSGVLAQWLDASEESTITISSGALLTSWTDKSGNNRNVRQTGAKQPTYGTAEIGVYPGVRFNGLNSSLAPAFAGQTTAYSLGSATFFTVIKANTVTSNRFVYSEAGTATNTTYYAPLATTTLSSITGAILGNATGTPQLNFPASSAPFFDGTTRLAMSYDAGNSFTTFSNGVPQSQEAVAYTRATSTINTYRIGAKLVKATESGWFAGAIGEFFIIKGYMAPSVRQKLEGYSAHKWGVSLIDHPYSTTPP